MIRTILLTPSQVEDCKYLAHGRNDPKIAAGVRNHRVTQTHGDFEIAYAGARAEMACATWFDVPMNKTFSLHGDNHEPDIFVNGWGVEIKAPMTRIAHLLFRELPHFKSDAAIRCYAHPGDFEHVVEMFGVVSHRRFMRNWWWRDFGYGPQHVVDDRFLSDADLLMLHLPPARECAA